MSWKLNCKPLRLACLTALSLSSLALGQARVVYDKRIPAPEPRLTEQERGRVRYLAQQAMQRGLWDKADFKPSQLGCDGSDFTINGLAPGSFTRPNSRQVAYLYMYCYFRPGWNQGVVIMEGNKVVAHYIFVALHSEMYALKDINRNGYSELALAGGFTGQGYTDGYLEIAELKPQRRLLATFNYENKLLVHEDNCGAVESGGRWQGLVIRVTPGPIPKFTKQQIGGACGNERRATSEGRIIPISVRPQPTGWTPAPLK